MFKYFIFLFVILFYTESFAIQDMRVCTGVPTGNFTAIGNEIKKTVNDTFNITFVPTSGSLENIQKLLNNECDIAPAQTDVIQQFEENSFNITNLTTISDLYTAYVHLLCPVSSGWYTIQDVANNRGKLIVGPETAGAAQTWKRIKQANPIYNNITTLNIMGGLASIAMVKENTDICMLWISGLNSTALKVVNNISLDNSNKPQIRLMNFDDQSIHNILDKNGAKHYRFATVYRKAAVGKDVGLYSNLIYNGWTSQSVTMPMVDILLLGREEFLTNLGPLQDYLIDRIQSVEPEVWGQTIPTQTVK